MITTIFGYKFTNKKLLKAALTHPSTNSDNNYQTLEFLGDRILSVIIAEYLYKKFPGEKEGDLSKRHIALVCGEMIATIAKENNVGSKIIMSPGEENTGGRANKSNLEDVVEAIFAAIYLDSNDLNIIRKIIINLWDKHLTKFKVPPKDPKSELQEMVQKQNYPLPEYQLIKTDGPSHAPLFTMKIIVTGQADITITARNKKKTELELARLMILQIKNHD